MKEIDVEEMKKLQLDILAAVDEVCKYNKIKYSLGGGSLIGAIRHKGYIPWDDDIDIYLPREDYKKLMEVFPKNYKDKYDIYSLGRDPSWERPYAKCFNTKTLLTEETDWDNRLGVNIDIFPVDSVPDDEEEWRRYNKRRLFLLHLFRCRQATLKGKRSLMKALVVFTLKFFTLPIPVRKFAELIDQYAQKYNGYNTSYLFTNCMGMLVKKRYLKSDFDNIIETEFENRIFYIMEGYDDCLKSLYGDYLKLPPKQKQVSHHQFKAWWK